MRQLPSTEEMISADDFAAIDSEESTGQILTDDDIVCLVSMDGVMENTEDNE